MKKLYTTLFAVLAIVQISYAQWDTSVPNQITYTGGNVGIGTSSPVYPLDVLTNINGTVAVQFTNANNGSAARTRFQLNNGVVYALINLNSSTYPIDPNLLQISSPGALTINTGALERMRITPAGNIGIGTNNLFKPLTVEAGSASGINQGLVINSAHAYGTGQGIAGSALVFSRNRTTDNSSIYTQAQIAGGNTNETTSVGGFLSFYTTASSNTLTEAMRIDANQRVGIGTTTPSKSLTVYPQGSGGVLIGNPITGAGNYTSLLLGVSADKNGYPYLQGTQSAGLYYGKLLLNPFGGRIGISSTAPISTFQVGDNVGKASIGMANGADLDYGTSYLGFNAARDSSLNWTVASDGTHNGGGVVWGDIYGDIYFAPLASTGNTTQTLTDAQIKSKINLSISATGVTHVKQIVVSLTNWPDYVFKKDYVLPSLSEVKTYIDQNRHLPEIPSEADIKKDGVNLGEMNKLLIKKIEELTLYALEQQKQIELLKQQQENNKQLNERMIALEKALAKLANSKSIN